MAIYVQDLSRPSWLGLELAVGLAFALSAVAAGAAMPFLGTRADRRDPRRQLMASLALIALFLLPQVVVPSAVVFLLCRIPVGIGVAGVTSAISVLTRMGARDGSEGRAFGALASAQNLGWGIGPILGAALAAAAGIPSLYVVSAAALLSLVVAVALRPLWFETRPATGSTPLLPRVAAETAD
jgi:MFS family permease